MTSAEVRAEAKMVEALPIMIEPEGRIMDGFRGCWVYNIRYVEGAIMVFLMHNHSQVRVCVYYCITEVYRAYLQQEDRVYVSTEQKIKQHSETPDNSRAWTTRDQQPRREW
jgi:hypothetical protein